MWIKLSISNYLRQLGNCNCTVPLRTLSLTIIWEHISYIFHNFYFKYVLIGNRRQTCTPLMHACCTTRECKHDIFKYKIIFERKFIQTIKRIIILNYNVLILKTSIDALVYVLFYYWRTGLKFLLVRNVYERHVCENTVVKRVGMFSINIKW